MVVYSFYGKPITELWSVTCHMRSPSVTCHPTEVNAPHLNPSQTGLYSINQPTLEGWKAELILVSALYLCGLPVGRQSLIQVVTT